MRKRPNPDQMLLDLARNEGQDVVHLPYTSEFEAVCQQINPAATIEDKHRIWEKLLGLGEIDNSPAKAATSSHAAPIAPFPSDAPKVPPSPSAQASRAHEKSGLLFEVHDPIPDLQPWTARNEPDLPPEHAERRKKMLAEIANHYLATREQRVALILQRFPETRDSDTALCIRYWKMFQADVLERWRPLELEVLFELDRIETIGRVRRMIQNDLRLF